ncbi:MAG: hypothetical protein U0350_41775 [Caldilineaceae bacterium]
MTIFHILLMVYAGLTLLAAVVGFSVCMVAGRVETVRKRQAQRQAHLVNLGKPKAEAAGAQGKTWLINVR